MAPAIRLTESIPHSDELGTLVVVLFQNIATLPSYIQNTPLRACCQAFYCSRTVTLCDGRIGTVGSGVDSSSKKSAFGGLVVSIVGFEGAEISITAPPGRITGFSLVGSVSSIGFRFLELGRIGPPKLVDAPAFVPLARVIGAFAS